MHPNTVHFSIISGPKNDSRANLTANRPSLEIVVILGYFDSTVSGGSSCVVYDICTLSTIGGVSNVDVHVFMMDEFDGFMIDGSTGGCWFMLVDA